MATQHQPASWVFGHFEAAQAESVGITNYFNIAILGLLLPAYSYTGMDGPAHMSEEVEGASMHPPKAILHGWAVMFVGGELTDLLSSRLLTYDAAVGCTSCTLWLHCWQECAPRRGVRHVMVVTELRGWLGREWYGTVRQARLMVAYWGCWQLVTALGCTLVNVKFIGHMRPHVPCVTNVM
eukprot:GHRQ01030331.1.p1 GENE.GHRQ01030331.1~~GHRQ01030331.1.p1  ORF type:complete len:181 (+),score=18.42 GHRQ01030331.1:157-699(+)